MALIADLLIAAALLAAVVIGARRGLLRSLTGLVVVVLAFVLASWAADRLADPVAQKLSPLVERRIEQKLTQQESASAESVLADFGFIGERLQELTQQVVRAAQESGASLLAALSQSVAHSVAYTLVYVVSFVLLLLVLGLLSKPLQLVTKLPVIHGANAVGGGALGLLSGLRKSLLAEVVAGSLHVAVAFDERLFAVHHSDRGAGAKLRHHRSSDIRHVS